MSDAKPYGLASGFESAVAYLACTHPRFYGRIGHAVDPDCVANEAAALSLRAARVIYGEMGRGPDSSLLVVQRLHRWRVDGKYSLSAISAVVDMFDAVEDGGVPNVEGVVNELAPVLRERLRREAVVVANEQHGRQGDLSRVVALEKRAASLGKSDVSIGTVLGDASFADIHELRKLTRLRTGIMELDVALKGGLQRAGLGCVMGATGAGKSMFLSHVAGVAAKDGRCVAAVSLEIPKGIWNARVIANMTNLPIECLLNDQATEDKAKAILAAQQDTGFIVVHQMSSVGTTVDHLAEWVANVEAYCGKPIEVLIVDYVDKLAAPMRNGKELGSYETGKIVMEDLRAFAEKKNIWCWSASQSQGRNDRKKRLLDHSDTADSINKPRIADLWITLNVSEEQEEISFFIAKHRTAKGRIPVGPLPTEFEVGRVAPIVD